MKTKLGQFFLCGVATKLLYIVLIVRKPAFLRHLRGKQLSGIAYVETSERICHFLP